MRTALSVFVCLAVFALHAVTGVLIPAGTYVWDAAPYTLSINVFANQSFVETIVLASETNPVAECVITGVLAIVAGTVYPLADTNGGCDSIFGAGGISIMPAVYSATKKTFSMPYRINGGTLRNAVSRVLAVIPDGSYCTSTGTPAHLIVSDHGKFTFLLGETEDHQFECVVHGVLLPGTTARVAVESISCDTFMPGSITYAANRVTVSGDLGGDAVTFSMTSCPKFGSGATWVNSTVCASYSGVNFAIRLDKSNHFTQVISLASNPAPDSICVLTGMYGTPNGKLLTGEVEMDGCDAVLGNFPLIPAAALTFTASSVTALFKKSPTGSSTAVVLTAAKCVVVPPGTYSVAVGNKIGATVVGTDGDFTFLMGTKTDGRFTCFARGKLLPSTEFLLSQVIESTCTLHITGLVYSKTAKSVTFKATDEGGAAITFTMK